MTSLNTVRPQRAWWREARPRTTKTDVELRSAAESLLIRAGETVNRIDTVSPEFIRTNPELELRNLKDARNVVAHGYDIVDPEILWRILADHLPAVVSRVAALLKTL